MNKKVKIVPTLLTHSFEEFKDKLGKIEKKYSLIQIDIMDGKFVKNKTFADLDKIKSLKSYKGNYELHLMVKEPLKVIKQWERFNKVRRIIFHYESMKDDEAVIDLIKYLKLKKIKAGIAINPKTSINKIEGFVKQIDSVLLMGVEPGWGGQSLKVSVLIKAKRLRKKYSKLNIGIDGGVNDKNLDKVIKSGVNIISTGSMLFDK